MANFHLIAQIFVITVCLLVSKRSTSTDATEVDDGNPTGKPHSSDDCEPTDYPFLVQIDDHCIGSLIERNIVFTTAKCALDAKNVKTMISKTPEESAVEKNKIHESFNHDTKIGLNNVGLIKLQTPLKSGLVKISETDDVKTCDPLKVAGTAETCFALRFVDGKSCATAATPYKNVANFVDFEFCGHTPSQNQFDQFFEYQGAPVVCNKAVVGLAEVEQVVGTAPYVKVYSYLQFIEKAKKELMAPPGQARNASYTEPERGPVSDAPEKSTTAKPSSSGNRAWALPLNLDLLYTILTLLVNLL